MNIQLHQIQTFLTTAQCSSFNAASEKLYISHAALIQQINALEKSLGFTLFVRSPRGIQLTESGRYFYQHISQLYDQITSLVEDCIRMEHQQSVIRVSNPNDLHTFYFYSDLFRSFSQEYPQYSVEFVPTTRERILEDCQNQKIDLGFFWGYRPRKNDYNLLYSPVSLELGVIASLQHPFSKRPFLGEEDLKDQDLYFSEVCYPESLYTQIPALRQSRLHDCCLTMEQVYATCQNGGLFLAPMQFHKFFPPLSSTRLNPAGIFTLEVVTRPSPSASTQALLDCYLKYEARQCTLS